MTAALNSPARITCRVCGSDQTPVLYPQARDYITGDAFAVRICQRCGAAFTDIGQADLSRYYPAQYRRYTPLILALLKSLYGLRVRRWIGGFTRPGSAFEMGCADGFMLDAMRAHGWRVLGNERSPAMLRLARAKGIPVFAGNPSALHQAPTFDLIVLFQVLEHLPEPAQTLATLSTLLKPGGRLIIGVPNFASWQSRFGQTGWFHLDVPRHLYHYTPEALSFALRQAGLQVEQTGFVSFEHDPYGWVQSALNRMDSSPNRLTRLLMRLGPPGLGSLAQLVLSLGLGAIALPLSLISWAAGSGAIMEVAARKPEAA